MGSLVLRLDHILSAWPAWNANLSMLRVSAPDFKRFAAQLPPELHRPMFMRAPVECARELPTGKGVLAFDTGDIREVRIEWAELHQS